MAGEVRAMRSENMFGYCTKLEAHRSGDLWTTRRAMPFARRWAKDLFSFFFFFFSSLPCPHSSGPRPVAPRAPAVCLPLSDSEWIGSHSHHFHHFHMGDGDGYSGAGRGDGRGYIWGGRNEVLSGIADAHGSFDGSEIPPIEALPYPGQ